MDARQVTEIFVERGLLTPEQAEGLVQQAATGEKPIEQLLVDYQVVDEEGFIHVIAESIGAEAYNLNEFTPDTTILGLIPSGLARLHGAMPIMGSGNTIIVALADPLNPQTIEDLALRSGTRDPGDGRLPDTCHQPHPRTLRIGSHQFRRHHFPARRGLGPRGHRGR